MIVATLIVLAALPFLVWPLLRGEPSTADHPEPAPDLRAAIEEVELDAASGRLDRAEAARRVAELRREAAV
jgi:cytochrome c-type biogenesis protein CcmI